MTALPDYRVPLTAAEYLALPEDPDGRRYELQEGWLMMSAAPKPPHQTASLRLSMQLLPQVPGHEVVQEVDVDLALAPPDLPGTVRIPDVIVVSHASYDRVVEENSVFTAADVLLAVEFLSPGSTRIDTLVKHHEYAEAGVGHYWIIDLYDGPSLIACHLAGEFGYQDAPAVRGEFVTDAPFPLRIDLPAMTRRNR